MTDFLIRHFVADFEETQNPRVRERYGMLSGMTGIAVNLFLFAVKIIAGMLSSSISIIADAFNNLSDAGSSIVTLLGFKLAGKPADREHPFGHGRIEYLSGLFISVAILLVGIELGRTSVAKIMEPEALTVEGMAVLILILSVGIKCWLAFFYRRISGKIHSAAIDAAAADSFNDCITTTVVLVSLALQYFFSWNVDGFAGVLVAVYIFYSGVSSIKDTLQPLLGQPPSPQFVRAVETAVLATKEIIGMHDLIVHDYGPGRCFISLHAEVPASMNIMAAHEVVDRMEEALQEKFHCQITVHMDPIDNEDPQTIFLAERMKVLALSIDPELRMHDFRLTHGGRGLKLIFDLLVPQRVVLSDEEIEKQMQKKITELDDSYQAVIRVDRSYSL